ncbi:ABC transporter permease [Candidatus Ruminimicrobium bovinum]|uniref:ABC transporter permease n=1 Tax=Candidatus Ruminimicrobium bovinum TaxID=3242779 RepID=UPI0039B8B282
MKYFFEVIKKEFKLIFTNKYYLFLVCLWPFLDFVFLGGIYFYGNVKQMPIAVIDKDNSKISRTITRYFNTSYAFNVKYKLDNVADLEPLFVQNKIFMGIYIPKDTQKNIKKFSPAQIECYLDGSNFLTSNLGEIEGLNIIGTINAGLKNTMIKKRGIQSKLANGMMLPIKNDSSKIFNPTYNYGYYLTPGLWIAIIGQILLIFGALTIGRDVEQKDFTADNIFLFICGKLFVYCLISLIYFEIMFRIFFPLFQIPFYGEIITAEILSVFFILPTILLGMLMSAVTGNKIDALKGCLLIGAPSFLMSGYTWPLSQMPDLIKIIAGFIPLTNFLEAFRKIYQQNMHLEYIVPFVKILIILIILYFIITYISLLIRFKLKIKK